MRKVTVSVCLLVALVFSHSALSTVLLSEGFEHGGARPVGWTNEHVSGTLNWLCRDGGGGAEAVRRPQHAYSGSYNALFYIQGNLHRQTKFVTPTIDFGEKTNNTTLTFQHFMEVWYGDQDELRVFYKTSATGVWTLLQEYTSSVDSWTLRTIPLPDPSGDYYIAFEGYQDDGHGVCIDNVQVTGKSSGPSFDLVPAEQTVTNYPRKTVQYSLTVLNEMGTDDEFSLSYLPGAWGAAGPATTGVITNDGSTNITAFVTIPSGAAHHETDTSTVVAVSVSDPSVSNTALLITHCEWYLIDYPLWCENFDSGWPFPGWTNYSLGDSASWTNATPGWDGTGQCAFHDDDNVTTGCDDWLASPAVNLNTSGFDYALLTFYNDINHESYYDYSGVMISTGDRDPSSGDYVEILEVGSIDHEWTPRQIDISAYLGSNPVYFAFRYKGDYAHEWRVDDVCAVGQKFESSQGIDWAILASPAAMTVECCYATPTVYGEVYIAGESGASGPAADVTAELGYGPMGSLPDAGGWTWLPAVYVGASGSNDVYATNLSITVSADFDYAFRFRKSAKTWVYADLDGTDNDYDPAAAGKLWKVMCPPIGTLLYEQPISESFNSALASFTNEVGWFDIFLADNFVVQSNRQIHSVRWEGIYRPTYPRDGHEKGFFLYFFDNAGPDVSQPWDHPGSLVYSGFYPGYACEKTVTNTSIGLLYRYHLNLDTPLFVLGGSTYWFGVAFHTESAYWYINTTTAAVHGPVALQTYDDIFTGPAVWDTNDFARDVEFEIYGIVPEPAMVVLVGVAAGLIALLKRRP